MPPVHNISILGNCSYSESTLVNGKILINWNDNDSSWLIFFSVISTTTHAFVKH